jgi:hypothetical protein
VSTTASARAPGGNAEATTAVGSSGYTGAERRVRGERRQGERRHLALEFPIQRRTLADRRVGPERRGVPEEVTGVTALLTREFGPALRFAGLVATSLTAITALLTFVGFLIEGAYQQMLGVEFPQDLNRYALEGARFVALSPVLVALAALPLVAASALWWVSGLVPGWTGVRSAVATHATRMMRGRGVTILAALALVQCVALAGLLQGIDIRNVLFSKSAPSEMSSWHIISFNPDAVRSWIWSDNAGAIWAIVVRQAFLPLATGLLLYQGATARVGGSLNPRNLHRRGMWLRANGLFFMAQVVLLLVNAGVFLQSREFPVVNIEFRQGTTSGGRSPPRQLVLLNRGTAFYTLYSQRLARVWTIPVTEVQWVEQIAVESVFGSPTVNQAGGASPTPLDK